MSFNPIYKMFTGDKHTKLPNDKKLNKQLDKFADILAGAIDNSVNIKWNRMIDDSGSSAKVIIAYDDNSQTNSPFAYAFDEPINLDPMKFNDEILNRVAEKLNVGDGSDAGDIQLSAEDSNVSNPFDHSSFTTQAQLAFEVILKDLDNEKNE